MRGGTLERAANICLDCRHFHFMHRYIYRADPTKKSCVAFPDGIPDSIWSGEGDQVIAHRSRDILEFKPLLRTQRAMFAQWNGASEDQVVAIWDEERPRVDQVLEDWWNLEETERSAVLRVTEPFPILTQDEKTQLLGRLPIKELQRIKDSDPLQIMTRALAQRLAASKKEEPDSLKVALFGTAFFAPFVILGVLGLGSLIYFTASYIGATGDFRTPLSGLLIVGVLYRICNWFARWLARR